MHVKIQGGGKNTGVHANTGSCAALVEYLQHEDAERLAEGKEVFDFFTGQGIRVTPGEVIEKIDRNHRKLCNDDAKFFHIDVDPSPDEIRAMGTTDAEIVASATILCQKLTDIYAKNFNHDKIKSGKDIMVFFKPHFKRGDDGILEFHIHGIVSRKDIHNQVKLSPMSNHRKTTKGPVNGGFDRKEFALKIEKVFDETFHYQRKVSDTFEYKLAMKQGTVEERAEQESKLTSEESREINTRKAEEIIPDVSLSLHDTLARIDARRRNEYWNKYHSELKPKYDTLKATCDQSFKLYSTAKDKYGIVSKEISDRYTRLHSVYDEMNRRNDDIQRAKTAKGAWKAISALVFAMNPVAGLLVRLVSGIITEANTTAAIQARRALRMEAQSIKTSIDTLQAEQRKLRTSKNELLKNYIEDKEEKLAFQKEITALKNELDKPIPEEQVKKVFSDFAKKYSEHLAQKEGREPEANSVLAGTVAAYSRQNEILSTFQEARSPETLRQAMANHGLSFSEEVNRHGVTDITITASGDKPFTVKVSKFGADYARQVMDAYEKATKRRPAYKVERSIERARTVGIAKKTSSLIESHNIEKSQRQTPDRNQGQEPDRGQSLTPGGGGGRHM